MAHPNDGFSAAGLEKMNSPLWKYRANSVLNFPPDIIRSHAQRTRIVVHERFPKLVRQFLDFKRAHGSQAERTLYAHPWTWEQQTARLVAKRPLVFMGSDDMTVLRDGSRPKRFPWQTLGTDNLPGDQRHLFHDYLSYDEMMLGSLLGVSGPSFFINDGGRTNHAVPGPEGSFEPFGYIVGLVGARFEKRDRMDSTLVLPPSSGNPKQDPRLTQIFYDFLGVARTPSVVFDDLVYKARMRVTLDILLFEASERAREESGDGVDIDNDDNTDKTETKKKKKKAYVYVVGLGLGVWQYTKRQPRLYIEAMVEAVEESLTPTQRSRIGIIDFAWMSGGISPEFQASVIRKLDSRYGIKVKFTQRNPAARLSSSPPEYESDHVLVLSYAWDANAFPGNEYWIGMLGATGDPAAASMSTVSELHNPIVNPGLLYHLKVLLARDQGEGGQM